MKLKKNPVNVIAVWIVIVAAIAAVMCNPEDVRGFLVYFGLMLFAALFYFIPTIAAHQQQHPHREAITVLNITTGWTFLGWVGALVWVYLRPAGR